MVHTVPMTGERRNRIAAALVVSPSAAMGLCAIASPVMVLLALVAAPFLVIPALLVRFRGEESAGPSKAVATFVAVACFTWVVAAITGVSSHVAWVWYLDAMQHPPGSGWGLAPDPHDPWNGNWEVDPDAPRFVAIMMAVALAGSSSAPFVALWATHGSRRWIGAAAVAAAGAWLALFVTRPR